MTAFSDPFAAAEAIAASKNAALYRAATHLPPVRQKFFHAAYASMRVIDDRIDDEFLALPEAERKAQRPAVVGDLTAWRAQIEAAKEGDPHHPGPLSRDVTEALRLTLGESDLDTRPWRRLADSLATDIAEASLESWDDFVTYGEGATAAPAAIFIYVLSCRHDPMTGYLCPLPDEPLYYARDMALFCYLIHILRDLRADVGRAERLLTLPDEALDLSGLTRTSLIKHLLADDFTPLVPLAEHVMERALGYLERGQERSMGLLAHLGETEAEILSRLFAVYIELAERISSDYPAFLTQSAAVNSDLMRGHLGRGSET